MVNTAWEQLVHALFNFPLSTLHLVNLHFTFYSPDYVPDLFSSFLQFTSHRRITQADFTCLVSLLPEGNDTMILRLWFFFLGDSGQEPVDLVTCHQLWQPVCCWSVLLFFLLPLGRGIEPLHQAPISYYCEQSLPPLPPCCMPWQEVNCTFAFPACHQTCIFLIPQPWEHFTPLAHNPAVWFSLPLLFLALAQLIPRSFSTFYFFLRNFAHTFDALCQSYRSP